MVLDREGECLGRAWMLWEAWQASLRGREALAFLTPGFALRDLAERAGQLHLGTAACYEADDTVRLKEWCVPSVQVPTRPHEGIAVCQARPSLRPPTSTGARRMFTHYGPDAMELATQQLRLLLLLDADDSHLAKTQQAMMAHRLHALGNSTTCARPVPVTAASTNDERAPSPSLDGWGVHLPAAGFVPGGGVPGLVAGPGGDGWAADPRKPSPPLRYLQWLALPAGAAAARGARHFVVSGVQGTGE